MRPFRTVPEDVLHALEKIDTCTVSNAIEQFRVRTRSEGFVNGSVKCFLPQLGTRVGYAVTATIRTASTPINGACYYDRADWWAYVRSMPGPRFLVVQDVDHMPGVGALFGEVHASIAAALGCVAYLTNGSVRDLPGVERKNIQLFAGCLSVSHSYAHVVEYDQPVEIGGLQIKPGDLLHGDEHGVLCVPLSTAAEIPKTAAQLIASEAELISFCNSQNFTYEGLAAMIHQTSRNTGSASVKSKDRDPQQ